MIGTPQELSIAFVLGALLFRTKSPIVGLFFRATVKSVHDTIFFSKFKIWHADLPNHLRWAGRLQVTYCSMNTYLSEFFYIN